MAEFDAYIEKLLEVQNRQEDRAASREELREIALGMGVSEEMWARIQKEVDAHIVRGDGFLRHKNWLDAMEEFEQARVFRPDDPAVLFGLAQSHAGRWRRTSDPEDWSRALAFAEKCLALDPGHEPSFKLISRIREGGPGWKRRRNAAAWIVLALILAAVIGLTTALLVKNPDPRPVPEVSEPTAPPAPRPAAEPAPPAEAVAPEEGLLNDLPVTFAGGELSSNLTLYPDWARYTRYDDAYSLTLAADVVAEGAEIEALKLKLAFLDENGAAVHIDEKEAWAQWRPVIRPGDVIPVEYLKFVKSPDFPDIREVRVSVYSIAKRPAPSEYEPAKPIEAVWDSRPPNYDLAIGERSSTVRNGFLGREEDMTHVLALELVNTGRSAISGLTLRLEYPDGRGGELASKKIIVNLESYPRFKPGQRRVFGTHARIKNASPEDFHGYQVFVQEID